MNKEKFILELEKVTGLDNNKCIIINDIMESYFIIGKKNKEKIVANIIDKLEMTNDEAEKYMKMRCLQLVMVLKIN